MQQNDNLNFQDYFKNRYAPWGKKKSLQKIGNFQSKQYEGTLCNNHAFKNFL